MKLKLGHIHIFLMLLSRTKCCDAKDKQRKEHVRRKTQEESNNVSFLVIADMHSMSSFAFADKYRSSKLQLKWDNLTDILENIKENYADTEIVLAPGDISSFGGISNDKIKKKTRIKDENDAVYDATMRAFGRTNELYQGAGFTTFLPCIGDHEIGGELS